MSILLFIVILLALVLVHEFGHFVVAKLSKMRVDEFAFGFPPKLFSKKIGETEYSVNMLPIGGFVKIYGEDALIEEDLRDEIECEARAKDRERSFIARPRILQAAVLFAGVAMNFVFAWFLYSVVFVKGTAMVVSTDEASPAAVLTILNYSDGSPLDDADVPRGAEIVSIRSEDGALEEMTPEGVRSYFGESRGKPVVMEYRMDSEEKTVVVTPKKGMIASEPERYALGVHLGLIETVSYSAPRAVYEGFRASVSGIAQISVGLWNLIGDSIRLKADLAQISGPVGLVGIVGDAQQNGGLGALMRLTAVISLNLVVINLLPLPALDGGRLVFVAIEAVRRKAISPKIVMWVNGVGFIALLILMLAVTVSDIVKLF